MKRRELYDLGGRHGRRRDHLPKLAFAEANRIDWYTSSDQNIIDFWTNIIKPKFEAANAGVTINLVDANDCAGLQAIEARALAALGSKADPQADFFEGCDARLPAGGSKPASTSISPRRNSPTISKINPLAKPTCRKTGHIAARRCCWRYDTTKLPADKAPKTWADLVAWIKANPGQFIYNRPDKGGSGGNFVRARHLRGQRQGPVGVQGRQLRRGDRRGRCCRRASTSSRT